jgi:hypothetical protein
MDNLNERRQIEENLSTFDNREIGALLSKEIMTEREEEKVLDENVLRRLVHATSEATYVSKIKHLEEMEKL